MAFELYSNSASTTLNVGGGINNSVTSITVSSSSLFPASGNFRAIIDSEIILVTAVSGTTWTITRGIEGSSAASHGNGSTITHIVTAASLILAGTLSGTFASRPTAGVAGRKYYCTDTPFWYLDNGSSWLKYFGSYPLTTPVNSGWTWDNQGSATLGTGNDMLTIGGSVAAQAFRYKTAPSTPYTIQVAFLPNFNPNATCQYLIGFRGAGGNDAGKIVAMFSQLGSGALTINLGEWNHATSFNTTVSFSNLPLYTNGLIFLRIGDDGTNFTFEISQDGINFATIGTVLNNAFLTPANICFGYSGDVTSSTSLIHLLQA